MKSNISLTVALLTYNRVHYLKEALEAILSQTYSDFELLVMDNHSTDKTPLLVSSYKDKRLKYIRLPFGGNGHANFAHAMYFAQSKYILITHDDDRMKPTMVEKQIEFLQNNSDISALSTNVSLIDEKGETIQNKLYDLSDNLIFDRLEYFRAYLQDKLWFPAPTTIYNKEHYFKKMGFSIDLTNIVYMPSADVLGLFLLNLENKVAILKEPLLEYRQHNNQESRNVDQSKPHLELFENIIKHTKGERETSKYFPAIYAMYIKYKIQHLFFYNRLNSLSSIKNSIMENIDYNQIIIDEFVINEIIFVEFKIGNIFEKKDFYNLLDKNIKISNLQVGYRDWLKRLYEQESLWERYDFKKIAILGSMLTAFMIAKDAQNNKIEVVNCLDSSIQRVGNNVLGVEIIPLDEVNKIENKIDAIILSSEREHEEALKDIVRGKLLNKNLPIISWKELVEKSF